MTRLLSDICRIFLAAAFAVAIFSCDRHTEVPVGGMSFNAHSDAFRFVAGNKIAVQNAESPFVASVEGDVVRFVGNVEQSDGYNAVYPYSALKYFSPSEPVVAVMSLPTVQSAVKDEIPHGLRFSVAHASDADRCMTFRETVVYLKFTIGPESGKIRAISVISDCPLTGDFSVMCDGGYDTYPMPGSANNACLVASGGYLEQGDYYLAVRYGELSSLWIAYEDFEGRIAMQSDSFSPTYEPGGVLDMGTVGGLDFQYRDVFPDTQTYFSISPQKSILDIGIRSSVGVVVNILSGQEWMSAPETKVVSSSVYRFFIEENTGPTRTGTFEIVGPDGDRRLLYTVVQYGCTSQEQEQTIRASLAEFYDSTGGDSWSSNIGWCSTSPLNEWYGLSVNQWGGLMGIYMYSNNLSGTLPESFDGLGPLSHIRLSSNKLSGNIPSYIYNVSIVELSGNSFGSLSDVVDPEKALTRTLYLQNNSISGALPENVPLMPHLTSLDITNNRFSGPIPESYGKLWESGCVLRLNGNMLSGEIPERIRCDERFKETLWTQILFQEGEGFDFSNVEIYADYDAFDHDGAAVDVSEYYASHSYTLYIELPAIADLDLLQELSGWYNQYAEKGFGMITYIPQSNYDWTVSQYDPQWQIISSRQNALLKMYIVDSTGRVVLNPASAGLNDILDFLEEKYCPYEDRVDGEVVVLQEAEEGNGIDIVLMGDGYDLDSVGDGTYEAVMHETMEHFFEIEPFSSYRRLFNVYMVTVVSESESDSRLGVSYGEGTTMTADKDMCFRYASRALPQDRMDEALVIVVANSAVFGGSTYMYASGDGDWSSGKALAVIPKVKLEMDFRGLVQHEAGGHGFAKLADEYYDPQGGVIPASERDSKISKEQYGWYRNIDFSSDPGSVKWSHILSDIRYEQEPEGLYEGGLGYAAGIWRPSYSSVMKDNQGSFNAPSREAIWYRIHKLAYGENWKYDFEEFAEYDAVNRKYMDPYM